jgi:hypothetical protein
MEQSNIRWGEIIGGLLIIGCSTALVISLWAQISQIPVFRFLIFTTVTAVLFGIGLYTEHRWKLPTTSRGILTIATLLVPLNFLAIAAVSAGNTAGALVIIWDGLLLGYLPRGEKVLLTFLDQAGAERQHAERALAEALARLVDGARRRALVLGGIDGRPARQSPFGPALTAAGFTAVGDGFVLRRGSISGRE